MDAAVKGLDAVLPQGEAPKGAVVSLHDAWLRRPLANAEALREQLPDDFWQQIALHQVLAQLIDGQSVDDVPAIVLESLPDYLKPIVNVLHYEQLVRQGETDAAATVAEQVQREHPEWTWMIKRVNENTGLLLEARQRIEQ